MTPRIDLTGATGAVYSYNLITDLLPPVSGNYVIIGRDGREPRVLCVGESDNLARVDWRGLLDQAQADYGAVEALFRLNVRRAVREQERDDLVARHDPPMNRAPSGRAAADKSEQRQATG